MPGRGPFRLKSARSWQTRLSGSPYTKEVEKRAPLKRAAHRPLGPSVHSDWPDLGHVSKLSRLLFAKERPVLEAGRAGLT